MFCLGIPASLAFWMALPSAALPAGSPPPSRAATWIARASFVNSAPRRASVTAFLCLIWAHLEWPAMRASLGPAQEHGPYVRGDLVRVVLQLPPGHAHRYPAVGGKQDPVALAVAFVVAAGAVDGV